MSLLGFETPLPINPESPTTMDHTVVWWSGFVVVAWLGSFSFFCLGAETQARIWEHRELVGTAAVLFAALFAIFGIGVLCLHKVFDKRIPDWERRHKLDHILFPLVGPFQPFFGKEHNDALASNPNLYVRLLFDPFIEGSKPKVGEALVRQFYRRLTWYWMTQIQDLAFYLWAVAAVVAGIARADDAARDPLFIGLAAWLLLWGINYRLAAACREMVREGARVEVNGILMLYRADLESLVRSVFAKAGMPLKAAVKLPAPTAAHTSVSGSEAGSGRRRVFLSSPMASLKSKAYTTSWPSVMRIKESLEKCGYDVFFAGAHLPPSHKHDHQWEGKLLSLQMDIAEIERADSFILHYPEKLPTSGLFELGYAFARGGRIVLFVRDHKDLPFLIQGVSQLPSVGEYEYHKIDDLCTLIESNCPLILGDTLPEVSKE